MSAAPRALLFVLAFLASIALAPTACADMAGPSASLPGSLDAKKPLHAPKAAVTEAIFANCFLAGTLVETDQGMKPIEQIEVGDQVLAHPEGGFHRGERAFKPVVRLSRNTTRQVCRLTIGPARPQGRTEAHVVGEAKEGGDSEEPPPASQQILCTPNHPIFLVGRGWIFTGKLKPGDLLVGASGTLLEVRAVEVWDELAPIFNFEVEEWHTYFVAGRSGAESVWVHNRLIGPVRRNVPWYGPLGPNKRATGMRAHLDPKYPLPKGARPGVDPPGYVSGTHERLHLLAKSLGGRGVGRNLATGWRGANYPEGFNAMEALARDALKSGHIVNISVTPIYRGPRGKIPESFEYILQVTNRKTGATETTIEMIKNAR